MFDTSRNITSFRKNSLRILKGKIEKRDFVGFDVETHGQNNEFVFCGLYYEFKGEFIYTYFDSKEDFFRFIFDGNFFHGKYFIATNLSFDFDSVFFGSKYYNDFKKVYRESNLIQAKYIKKNEKGVRNHHGAFYFIDTMSIVPFSVEVCGKVLNIDKLDKPVNLGKNVIDKEMLTYNNRDCEISLKFAEFCQEWFNHIGGNYKNTISSSAMDLYRRKYLDRILIKEQFILQDDKISDFIFKGYYGGRTEVFKRGVFEDVNYYDVNSLYPSVMIEEYPLPNSVNKPKEISLKNIMDYEGVSEVKILTPENMNIPILPFRKNDKLIFPLGTFTGVYNHDELRYAISYGYKILRINNQIIYTETFKPFEKYIKDLYAIRKQWKEEGRQEELIPKLLMNSLYGKFGQHKISGFDILNKYECDYKKLSKIYKSGVKILKETDKLIYYKTEFKEFNSCFSFPILSSYTTSKARIQMHKLLMVSNPIYIDTDSIITQEELLTSKELGDLKLEYKLEWFEALRPKFYRMKIKDYVIDTNKENDTPMRIKIKGLRKAKDEDFTSALNGETIIKEKFAKLRECIKRDIPVNAIIPVKKKFKLLDEKRLWTGNNSVPLVLENG